MMSRLLLLLSLTFFLLSSASCKHDEDDEENQNPTDIEIESVPVITPVGLLRDGGIISDVNFYCLEVHPKEPIGSWAEYNLKVKTLKDYDEFRMNISFEHGGYFYRTDDWCEKAGIEYFMDSYNMKKTDFMVRSYYQHKGPGQYAWPYLYTAYANGDVTITCDKELFSEAPGTTLNKYFDVFIDVPAMPIGVESPRFLYEFGEKPYSDMDSVLQKGAWLTENYWLHFPNKPAERYDEITLYLTFPILREHLRDIAVAKYKGIEPTIINSEAVFRKECKIRFDWN